MKEDRLSKRLQFWIGIGISIACLLAIFIFIRPSEILEELANTRYQFLFLAMVSIFVFMVLRAVRWQFLLQNGWSNTSEIAYSKVFHIQNIGYLLTNILPFRLGDVARAILIGNVPPITISKGISTMVVERVFDLLFFVILFPFALTTIDSLPEQVRTAFLLVGALAVLGVIVLIVAANQRSFAVKITYRMLSRLPRIEPDVWNRRLNDFLLGLGTLTRPKDGLTVVLLSIVVWIPILVGYHLAMMAVNLEPTLLDTAFVVSVAAFSVTAPSSPGQVGVFEAGVTFAIAGILGMPKAQAASFAFLYHAANYVVLGVLGVIGIFRTSNTFGSVIASTRSRLQSDTN
jgi:uncharacterized protein (TIRG00374 family)